MRRVKIAFVDLTLKEKPGDKIYFVFPNSGHEWQENEARAKFKLGAAYTVERMQVGSCMSKVWLVEFPNEHFNTVLFGVPEENENEQVQEEVQG